jgi:hypothetical protein
VKKLLQFLMANGTPAGGTTLEKYCPRATLSTSNLPPDCVTVSRSKSQQSSELTTRLFFDPPALTGCRANSRYVQLTSISTLCSPPASMVPSFAKQFWFPTLNTKASSVRLTITVATFVEAMTTTSPGHSRTSVLRENYPEWIKRKPNFVVKSESGLASYKSLGVAMFDRSYIL